MFRHFVPSRELHSLATLARLSLVDLPSANSIKCCSPPASLKVNKSGFMEVFRMKQKVPMICNIVSLILLIVFVIKSIVDYTQYSTSLNSAPFYLWVLVNALFLVIPAIILFVIGFVVKKKQ